MPPLKKGLPAKTNKIGLFDIIANITFDKKDNWFNYSGQYEPFMTNRTFSMDNDYIGVADIANRFDSGITKKMQYDFYRTILPKAKKHFKFVKKEKSEDIDMIAHYYNINKQTAKKYAKLLTPDQIEQIRSRRNHVKDSGW